MGFGGCPPPPAPPPPEGRGVTLGELVRFCPVAAPGIGGGCLLPWSGVRDVTWQAPLTLTLSPKGRGDAGCAVVPGY